MIMWRYLLIFSVSLWFLPLSSLSAQTESDEAEAASLPTESATPEETKTPPPEPTSADDDDFFGDLPDFSPIRAELAKVMDELVQARSRIAVVGRELFRTKVEVRINDRTGSSQSLTNLSLRLDGAPVFRKRDGKISEDKKVFTGFATPGPHSITLDVTLRARDDGDYQQTRRETFRFKATKEKLTEISITLDDDSDIAEDFADDGEGEYDIRTRVRVSTRNIPGLTPKKSPKKSKKKKASK